ncbi:MAG: biotin transporter BioY [Lachnospiraceae bacterium]|jgi:Uncharacterized conserved protein|nr:biotin transporter BioY [Lachnospiraceae bacterium]
MKKYDLTTQSMVRIAMFTAVLSVLSVLQIPMPSGVPLTLQTFAVALCGAVLGAWSGPASVALYVAVGAVGIPVFAGMKGGIAVLVGPTGGFLFGFLFLAWLTGAGVGKKRAMATALGMAGLVCCHLLGILGFILSTGAGVFQAFVTVSLPYLLKDALSVAAAVQIGEMLRKRLVFGHVFK